MGAIPKNTNICITGVPKEDKVVELRLKETVAKIMAKRNGRYESTHQRISTNSKQDKFKEIHTYITITLSKTKAREDLENIKRKAIIGQIQEFLNKSVTHQKASRQ